MSNQVVCDACGEPINTSEPYYTGSGQKVQIELGSVTVLEVATQFDFHVDHVPWLPENQPQQATPEPAARTAAPTTPAVPRPQTGLEPPEAGS